jgi:uncharacterized membrane protein
MMENQDTTVTPGNASPTIRSVNVNRGVEWLVGGFRMFAKAPGPWLLAALALLIGSWILGLFWIIGGALSTAFSVVFTGAMMRAAQSVENGQDFASGLQAAATSVPLWILGALAAAMSFGMFLVLGVLGFGAFGVGMMSPGAVGGMIGIGMLVMLVVIFALSAALWLAPALVVLKGVNPVDAVRLSLTASVRNIAPFLIFALLAMIACIIGALPLGLGLLVVFPVLMCASYLAYKDIFEPASALEGVAYTPE